VSVPADGLKNAVELGGHIMWHPNVAMPGGLSMPMLTSGAWALFHPGLASHRGMVGKFFRAAVRSVATAAGKLDMLDMLDMGRPWRFIAGDTTVVYETAVPKSLVGVFPPSGVFAAVSLPAGDTAARFTPGEFNWTAELLPGLSGRYRWATTTTTIPAQGRWSPKHPTQLVGLTQGTEPVAAALLVLPWANLMGVLALEKLGMQLYSRLEPGVAETEHRLAFNAGPMLLVDDTRCVVGLLMPSRPAVSVVVATQSVSL